MARERDYLEGEEVSFEGGRLRHVIWKKWFKEWYYFERCFFKGLIIHDPLRLYNTRASANTKVQDHTSKTKDIFGRSLTS